jgi:hypothetical protein
MLTVDYLQFKDQLQIYERKEKRYIFDVIRKKELILTSEELVRQLFVQYLMKDRGFSIHKIALEKALLINERIKRFDILVYHTDFHPFILVECKAPNVNLSTATFEQAAWYNFQLKADYLIITNGKATYCCKMDYEEKKYDFCDFIPTASHS